MLPRSVNSFEWFFVEKNSEIVPTGNFSHYRHQQQIVIVGQIGLFKNRGNFELIGRNFIMTGFNRDTQHVTLDFEVLHESFYSWRYSPEIVIFQLLIFGTFVSHESSTGKYQIGTSRIQTFIYQKIFLFPTQIGIDVFYIFVEISTYGCCRFVYAIQCF